MKKKVNKKTATKKPSSKKKAPSNKSVKKSGLEQFSVQITQKEKAPVKTVSKNHKKSPGEKSFDFLIGAWLDSTMNNLDVPGQGVDFSELINRISTIFRVSLDELGVSVEDARSIAYSFGENYAHDQGEGDDYVCDDCLAKEAVEADKTLN